MKSGYGARPGERVTASARLVALAAAAMVLLAGCATTSGTDATEVRSGFSSSRIVTIAPHGGACRSMSCGSIGGQWDSAKPDSAVLTVQLLEGKWLAITKVDFNIDGRLVTLPTHGSTQFSSVAGAATARLSRANAAARLQLFRDIRAAGRVWVRVHTTDGYVEFPIIDGQEDSKAYHAIGRFLAQIDAPK